jgi:transcriptional regulator with XRE-family HTH domain/tetratricopeptide (TPR) repeat protein
VPGRAGGADPTPTRVGPSARDNGDGGAGSRTPSALGRALRKHREAAGLTQEALAESAGVSVRTISDLERGVHLDARSSTLNRLVRALDLPPRDARRLGTLRHGDGAAHAALPALLRHRAGELPLAGRSDALERARAVWDGIVDGGTHALLYAGEAGIGKSRLLCEVASELVPQRATVLAGRCDETMTRPYGAVADALRARLQREALDELRIDLGPLASQLALVLPELESVVGAPKVDVDAETSRMLLFEAIDAVFDVLADEAPLVLAVDDLHAADALLLDVLRFVLRPGRQRPLLLLGAYRETEVTAPHPLLEFFEDLHRHRLVTRVHLSGLDTDALGKIVAASIGDLPTEPVLRQLKAQTGGNPFFVEEVLTNLGEQGLTLGETIVAVPEGVRDVVRTRVQRLRPATRHALEQAAVVGDAIDRSLFEQFADTTAMQGLQVAVANGFIDDRGGHLTFRHGIVRAVLLQDLGRREAAAIHWQVGEALERIHRDDAERYVPDIAHHLGAGASAGDPEKASRYLERAGEQHFRALAFDDAVAAFQAALALLRDPPADDLQRLRILELLAETHFWRDDPDAMRVSGLHAAEVAQRSGTPEDLARTVVLAARWNVSGELSANVLELLDEARERLGSDDSPALSEVLAMRAYILLSAERGFETRLIADEAEAMARRCDNNDALALTLVVRTYTEAGMPNIEAMDCLVSEFEQVARRVTRADHRQQFVTFALRGRAFLQIGRGDRDGLMQSRAALEEIAERTRATYLRAQLLFADASLASADGRFDDAQNLSREAVETWRAHPDALRAHLVQLAAIGLERGQHDVVLEQIDAAVGNDTSSAGYAWRAALAAGIAATGDRDDAAHRLAVLAADDFAGLAEDQHRPHAIRWLSEAVALLDDADLAASLLPLVQPYAGQILFAPFVTSIECAADRPIAQLLTVLGRYDESDRHYERAAALEAGAAFTGLETRTQWWWAASLARGDRDVARAEELGARVHRCAEQLGLWLPAAAPAQAS